MKSDRMLTKSEIDIYVKQFVKSLFIETFCGSKPTRYLKVKTTKGVETLGRVPKTIHRWHNTTPMDTQSGFCNVRWDKFF